MIRNMVASALIAGCAAWLLAAVLHFAFVQKLILLGEAYESGQVVHFQAAGPAADDTATAADADAHSHDDGAQGADGHAHGTGDDTSDLTRNFWTAVFFGLVYVAYAMILVAGFGLARVYGRAIDAPVGVLWGIAAFAAFQLVPAMGLAPELPGTIAADLGDRQVWWWGTVVATGLGLALVGYGRGVLPRVAAVVILALPHVIGAPELGEYLGTAPPEVGAAFSARVLGAGLAVWALLGGVAGYVWQQGNR